MTTLEGVQHQSLELLTVTLEQLRPSMMCYGTRRFGLPYHVVEDCVEDTYLKIAKSFGEGFVLHEPKSVHYIRGVFFHVCVDYTRRSRKFSRNVPLEDDKENSHPTSTDPTPLEIAVEEDTRLAIRQAVASLSPLYRDVLTGVYAEQAPPKKIIAQQQKISLSTLKLRLCGAKDILRSRLRDLFPRAL